MLKRSIALRALVLLTTLLMSGLTAAAQPAPPLDASPLVVHARVGAQRSAWDVNTGVIVTYVEVEVLENFGASAAPARLVLKQLGGRVGGVGLWIAGQAAFYPGETALLYLSVNRADATLETTGLARGKLPATAEALAAVRAAAATRSPMPATPFVAEPAEYGSLARDPEMAFEYLPTDGGYPARWHEVDSNATLRVDSQAIPQTWSHATSGHVAAAVNLWRTSGMDLSLQEGTTGLAAACPVNFTGNGRITVAFNDPCGAVNDWVVGGGYYTTGDLRTVNGVTFQKFVQGFVVLNDSGPQSTAAGCFQDAVTHGLGHALGLGHTNSGGAIMQAAPPGGCSAGASGLSADDRNGVTGIYQGIPSGGTPPATPTAFTVTSSLSVVTMNWTPASTGGQAQRYLIDAGTMPGNYNLGTIAVNAPATSTAVGGAPPGNYYLRLRAENALGTSAPTAERTLNVGNCMAPPPPASFTGSANGAVVNLQWSPPASGVVQGYQLAAGTVPGAANIAVLPFPASVTSLGAAVPYGTYYARVHATNVCGVSAPSAEVVLVVQPCAAAPQSPTGLVATVNGGVVTLNWTAPGGVAPTSYTIVAGSAPGAANILVYPTGTTATGLAAPAPSATYHIRVIATNPCGQSGASNEVVVVVP